MLLFDSDKVNPRTPQASAYGRLLGNENTTRHPGDPSGDVWVRRYSIYRRYKQIRKLHQHLVKHFPECACATADFPVKIPFGGNIKVVGLSRMEAFQKYFDLLSGCSDVLQESIAVRHWLEAVYKINCLHRTSVLCYLCSKQGRTLLSCPATYTVDQNGTLWLQWRCREHGSQRHIVAQSANDWLKTHHYFTIPRSLNIIIRGDRNPAVRTIVLGKDEGSWNSALSSVNSSVHKVVCSDPERVVQMSDHLLEVLKQEPKSVIPVIVEGTIGSLRNLAAYEQTCLLNRRVYPSLLLDIDADTDVEIIISELKSLLAHLRTITKLRVLIHAVLHVVETEIVGPVIASLMKYVNSEIPLIRCFVIGLKHDPLRHLRLQRSQREVVNASFDTLAMIRSIGKALPYELKPDDFRPLQYMQMAAPLLSVLKWGELNFNICPHQAIGTVLYKASSSTGEVVPMTKYIDVDVLRDHLYKSLDDLREDSPSTSSVLSLLSTYNQAFGKSMLKKHRPNVFRFLSSEGYRQDALNFSKRLQYIVVRREATALNNPDAECIGWPDMEDPEHARLYDIIHGHR
eukprot:Clim_evm54s225 gene=Clim_evmTU54s225